ncbi:MAG TPA: response regulator [Verrucomicrobiae bacterium]|nr:response regulator [Verrucomicrobiae bacterium]
MKKILIVDDEAPTRQAMRASLNSPDYTVLDAESGESGFEIAVREQPDLIISDVNLTGMTGLALLERLRALPATAAIPVILMTGNPENASVRCSMERGADDYLAKPFGRETLVAAVAARLERQQTLQEHAKANEARLRDLLSATRDFITIARPHDGGLLYLNSAGRSILELGPHDPIHEILLTNVFCDTAAMTFAEQLGQAQRDGIWIGESHILGKSGARIPVSAQIMAHKQPCGKLDYFSIVARDISERQRAEKQLREAHENLVRTSRLAGMAEIAAGVLHNVGNVLNSINVASTCVTDNLKKSKTSYLGKVVSLLRAHKADLGEFLSQDPDGKRVVDFLERLAEELALEHTKALKELNELQSNVQHVKEIITVQQNYAKLTGTSEPLRLEQIVEDAIRINAPGLQRSRVQLIRQFDDIAPVVVERHKMLQILANLIRNACQACESSGTERRVVVVLAKDAGGVRISVADNGVGISPDHLPQIFNYGFTTKKDGHGFGLRSAALAAKEMGAKLSAHSEGLAKGAIFTLELPCRPGSSELN